MIPAPVIVGVLFDAVTTVAGLRMGFTEVGPVASRLVPVLGLGYFVFELMVVGLVYWGLARRIPEEYAVFIAPLGPWVAGAVNLGFLLVEVAAG